MKIVILCTCFLALTTAWPVAEQYETDGKKTLEQDLNDFLNLIPILDIVGISMKYLANEPDVQNAVLYFLSEDFKNFILEVEEKKEYKNFLEYLNTAEIKIYDYLDSLHDIMGLPSFKRPSNSVYKNTEQDDIVCNLINEIKSKIDDVASSINDLYTGKITDDTQFKKLIVEMRSDNMKTVVKMIVEHSEFQDLLKHVKTHNCINTTSIANWLKKIFEWDIQITA